MKTQLLTILGAAFIAASASFAGAPSGPMAPPPAPAPGTAGPFIGVDAGAFWLQDYNFSGFGVDGTIKFKTGWGVNVPLGYDFGNGLSIFVSGGFNEAEIDSVNAHGFGRSVSAGLDGVDAQFIPIMGNVSYNIPLASNLSWYVGAGAGTVGERLDASGFGSTGWNWEFGFQAFTGINYSFTPHASFNLGYRFMYVNDGASFDGVSVDATKGHNLEAGFTFKF